MRETADLTLVQACEQRIVNAWPAVDTLIMQDWAVRLAGGYSGRANSASPMVPGARLDDALLAGIEALFSAAGLVPCIRLTPLADASVATMIAARGYRRRDASIGMIAPLAPAHALSPQVQIAPAATPGWVRGVSALQDGSKRDADAALMAIVSRVRLPAGFATLIVDGQPLGFGMSVVERGMAEIGSIILAPEARGKGHGRRLVTSLLAWAADAGASRAYLQVEQGNAVASRLYASLGFTEAYRYQTHDRPG